MKIPFFVMLVLALAVMYVQAWVGIKPAARQEALLWSASSAFLAIVAFKCATYWAVDRRLTHIVSMVQCRLLKRDGHEAKGWWKVASSYSKALTDAMAIGAVACMLPPLLLVVLITPKGPVSWCGTGYLLGLGVAMLLWECFMERKRLRAMQALAGLS